MKYRVYLEPDEDGVFMATCPALPGCVSEGRTRVEATANIREAIEGYLKSLRKHGDPLPPSILDEVNGVAGGPSYPWFPAARRSRHLEKRDTTLDEQHRSHIILRRNDPPHRRLSVPNHKELAKGTLRALVREAGLTVEEFATLL